MKESQPNPDLSPNVPWDQLTNLEKRVIKILSLNKEGTIFSREQREGKKSKELLFERSAT